MIHTLITRYVVLACAIGLFTLGGYLAYLDRTASALATGGFAVLCLFYVFLPEFKRFKGFGVEAELLEQKIEEADRLMTQLRSLTFPIAEMLFSVVSRMGRWDSMVPRRDRHRIMEEIEKQLSAIGVTPVAINEAKKDWHRFNVIDLSRPMFEALHKKVTAKISQKDAELAKIPQPIPAGSPEYKKLLEERKEIFTQLENINSWHQQANYLEIPRYLNRIIEESPCLTNKERDEIRNTFQDEMEDLDFYAKNRNFRRLDWWLSGKD